MDTAAEHIAFLLKRIAALESLIDSGGRVKIKGMCYQDFIGILMNNGYIITAQASEPDGTYMIDYRLRKD